jgi:serine/threonine-protein kinase
MALHPNLPDKPNARDLNETIVANDQSPAEAIDSRSTRPPSFGTDIGEYELLDVLGRGGMGVVYRARQKQLDRLDAIKILTAGDSSAESINGFVEEARIAAKARHPNLVGVYSAGQYHGWPYCAMELIEGTNLADKVEDGKPMNPVSVAELMVKVARAVAHLHELDIVHCDLKPENILLDKDDVPYVTDFGISKTLKSLSLPEQENVIAGSPAYMAPEQASGKRHMIGYATDVYGMGAVLYRLLTGKPTFDGDSVTEVIAHTIGRSPRPPRQLCRSIPLKLEAICMKCLEKEPEARYASASEFADDLQRFLSNEPVEAHGPPVLRRFARWIIREPALAGRFLALAVLIVVELLWYHVFSITSARFHWSVMTVGPLWGAMSYFLQYRSRTQSRFRDRVLWALSDNLLLSTIVYFSDTSVSCPVVVGYLIIVVGSAFWHRVSLVHISSVMSMTFYGLLWLEASLTRPDMIKSFDHQVIFLSGLLIVSFMASNLAKQIEILAARNRL